ncbi:MAG: hypothetical protein QOD42_1573 [Sphingomonadales bacterium]|jgi:hypothetical protein|nr:hypothetical protein [Sphingomonadales bacterium]
MKKQISRTLLGFFAALVLTAAANAQTSRAVEVQVPFDFVAGQRQLPAGRYTVRRVRVDSESALLIRGVGGGAAAVVLTNRGGENPSGASLTFRQHGERYFLAEVSMPGTASVRELPKTGGERAAEREAAARSKPGTAEPKAVTITGSLR